MSTTPASPAAPAVDPAQPLRFQDSAALRLVNVEAEAAAHPQSFHIPLRAERERLPVGRFAQLIFRTLQGMGPTGERLWVRVTDARDGHYEGLINNDPVVFPGLLRCGMAVAFGPEHIAKCETPPVADPVPVAGPAPAADPLHRLLELAACWRRSSGLPAGVPAPTEPMDPATLQFCGAVVQEALLTLGQGEEDALDSLQALANLADLWVSGQGEPPGGGESPPISLDPDTLRYCGQMTREGVFDVLHELISELKEEEAQFTVRGFALYLWRVWCLVTTLRQEPPPTVALNDLWMDIDRQLQQTADRLLRAAVRTGYCAVQEGCGRPYETVAAAPPDPGAFQALLATLAALGAAWQDAPPVSHRAAGDQLAALLRAHRALHDQAAPGLCAVCRPIFLSFLAHDSEGG